MSKRIETIPLDRVERIAIMPNPLRLTLEEAMEAQEAPPDIGINGGYYDPDWSPAAHLKVDGKVLAAEKDSGDWGYGWDTGPDIRMIAVPPGGATACRNHITVKPLLTPWDGIDAPLTVGAALQGRRGWTALGVAGGQLIIWASSDGADGIKLHQLRQEMHGLGCETALALDGGQSVKYRDKGVYITNPARPAVGNYIFIWLKQEDKPVQPKRLYRVQVGAFGVKANAERLRDELAGKGYPGFIQEVEV